MNGNEDVVEVLRSIESELSSIKLWIPSVPDPSDDISSIRAELERTNQLLEQIRDKLDS